jgi:hypothetical protein
MFNVCFPVLSNFLLFNFICVVTLFFSHCTCTQVNSSTVIQYLNPDLRLYEDMKVLTVRFSLPLMELIELTIAGNPNSNKILSSRLYIQCAMVVFSKIVESITQLRIIKKYRWSILGMIRNC